MSQLLVTVEANWYQSIASIKNYTEGQYEQKILKYAADIFASHYPLKCKFPFIYKRDRKKSYEPDFLLISKNFSNWVIVEVELCGKALTHTKKQIRCFNEPEFDPKKLVKYLITQRENASIVPFAAQLTTLIENKDPKILVIYDDYCLKAFENLRNEFSHLQICVIETYKTASHYSEAYRISGDYPYEISGVSQLSLIDDQHYEVLRPSLLTGFGEDVDIELNYLMRIIKGRILKDKKKVFLKIPVNPFPNDINLQLSVDISNKLIIQRL